MMTILRSERRTQRTAGFTLECLDDRIVPSAIGAKAQLAAAVPLEHTRAADQAPVAFERHEARLARAEARHEARLERLDARHHIGIIPLSTTTIRMNPPAAASTLAPTVAASISVAGTVASAPTLNPTSLISSGAAKPTAAIPNPTTMASTDSSSNTTSSNPLPANVSGQLQSLYEQYEAYVSSGGSGSFSPTGIYGLVIDGTNVGINIHTSDSADFNTVLAQLQSDGLQVTQDSAAYGLIDGMVSIGQLPVIARASAGLSVTPMFQPTLK